MESPEESKVGFSEARLEEAELKSSQNTPKITEKSVDDLAVENGEVNSQSATGPENDNEFVVWWQEPIDQDSENPMNWRDGRKWAIIGILSFFTFLTPLASSMLAPGVPLMLEEFGTTSDTESTFVVSIFVLGFAFGPLVIAPLSELYGRVNVYHVMNVFFVIFTVLCAVSNDIGVLLACRFFAGFAGVATITCGSGTIADLMPREKRSGAMAIWSIGPLLGPVIGPVAAGFLVEAVGWRWVFWVIAIAASLATALSFFILRETYAPVLLERKAARRRKETGDERYRSKLGQRSDGKSVFGRAFLRPARLFFLSPIVAALCTYVAVTYGLLYILFTTFTFVYREIYGFSADSAGLSFIGAGVGNLLGLAYSGSISDRLLRRKQAKGITLRPEDRLDLILTVPATIFLPVGLMIYGWTADKHIHWIVPMVGTAVMGFGMIGSLMCVQTYLVDAFTLHAASATAANAVFRSLLGALLPLCGLQLYDAIGLGWGNTLLALVALMLAPVLWLLGKYGERIRTNARWQREF